MKTDRKFSLARIVAALAISLSILPVLSGCGESGHKAVSEKVKDKKAYNLGQAHGRDVIAISADEDALQDALLEVRARITNISDRIGPQSAHDYEAGFSDCIRQNSDSLAAILF